MSQKIPPGTFGLPLIGENISFFTNPNFPEQKHKKYGDIFKTNVLGNKTIFIRGIEANKFVLQNEDKYFQAFLPVNLELLFGKTSVSAQTGERHLELRKILYPLFQKQSLEIYLNEINVIIEEYLEKWQKRETFAWYPEFRSLTFDIAAKIIIGLDKANQSEFGKLMKSWEDGIFAIPLKLPWTKLGIALKSRDKLLQYLQEEIASRLQKNSLGTDIFGYLIQAHQQGLLSSEEVGDQTLNLLFAGYSSLTSSLTSACLLLAEKPSVFQKLKQEINSLKFNRIESIEQLDELVYLEQVTLEILRYLPAVGVGFRQIICDCEFQGYQLQKGWNLIYQIGLTHRFSGLFDKEDEFIPERFKEPQKIPYGSFIPFGGGIRECIGKALAILEIKLIIAKLTQYQWLLVPEQNLDFTLFPTPHPKDELIVKLTKINNAN
ncbi:MAG: cytochrome P450 [Crocosphaera sp.]